MSQVVLDTNDDDAMALKSKMPTCQTFLLIPVGIQYGFIGLHPKIQAITLSDPNFTEMWSLSHS